MSTLSKFAPKIQFVRDPRDSKKTSGPFYNWPRFLYFGGVSQRFTQSGSKGPTMRPETSAVGPISDRGRGRR
jgi:hypothetical protein